MKKIRAIILSMLMVVMCLFALAGCNTGKYKFESITVTTMGANLTVEVGESLPGIGELTEDFMVIELKGGKKAIVTSSIGGETNTQEGTWKKGEEKGTIVITIDDEEMTFTKDGKTLTAEIEGMGKVTLSK